MSELSLQGERVAVLGLARTGVATTRALVQLGAIPVIYDRKSPEQLSESLSALAALSPELHLGSEEFPNIEACRLLVASPGFRPESPILVWARESGVPVWPEIELAYRVTEAPIVAVTGTNGKTTTAAWIGDMLNRSGVAARVGGNLAPGTPLIELALDAGEGEVLVAEVSSFQLETISGFRPRVAVLTNISEDHLDRHPDVASYAAAKARLFAFQQTEDWAVVNADSSLAMEASRGAQSRRRLFSSGSSSGMAGWVKDGALWLSDLAAEGPIIEARGVKLLGTHNLENGLAAALAARVMGATREGIRRSLEGFAGVAHRMEPLGEVAGVLYINNSMCTNPDAWARSIEAVDRPLWVIAGGRNKGFDFTEVGARVAPRLRGALLIGEAALVLEEALKKGGLKEAWSEGSLESAVRAAARAARPGDAVMLAPACASMDMFQDFMERGDRFRAEVEALGREEDGHA
ncbi:MAG TPA: UDP-N-acetylmuramoyl-L-alanine--D-glutamate ligase [Armatimonadota bacterium]